MPLVRRIAPKKKLLVELGAEYILHLSFALDLGERFRAENTVSQFFSEWQIFAFEEWLIAVYQGGRTWRDGTTCDRRELLELKVKVIGPD